MTVKIGRMDGWKLLDYWWDNIKLAKFSGSPCFQKLKFVFTHLGCAKNRILTKKKTQETKHEAHFNSWTSCLFPFQPHGYCTKGMFVCCAVQRNLQINIYCSNCTCISVNISQKLLENSCLALLHNGHTV